MIQVATPESSSVVALPPVVVTDDATTFNPATCPVVENKLLSAVDCVCEAVVCCAALVLTVPPKLTDPNTILSIETAP